MPGFVNHRWLYKTHIAGVVKMVNQFLSSNYLNFFFTAKQLFPPKYLLRYIFKENRHMVLHLTQYIAFGRASRTIYIFSGSRLLM
jgi:hypothetical protein